MKPKLYKLIDQLIGLARGEAEPSFEAWTDAVALDPTEPRVYEGDSTHEG